MRSRFLHLPIASNPQGNTERQLVQPRSLGKAVCVTIYYLDMPPRSPKLEYCHQSNRRPAYRSENIGVNKCMTKTINFGSRSQKLYKVKTMKSRECHQLLLGTNKSDLDVCSTPWSTDVCVYVTIRKDLPWKPGGRVIYDICVRSSRTPVIQGPFRTVTSCSAVVQSDWRAAA